MSELHVKFGELLKLERKRKGLSLDDLSDRLKINQTSLEHIENGEIGELPSMIYYNLFAKAFAEALGIDYDRTIEAIKEDLGVAINGGLTGAAAAAPGKKVEKPPRETAGKASAETNAGKLVKKLLYMFGIIVVVFVVFLVIYKFAFVSDLPLQEQATTSEALEADDVEPADAGEPSDQQAFDWDVQEYEKPETIRLKLIPQNESWSTVLADGDTVIFRNLIPGRVYQAEAQYRLMVSIGIPSQVLVELNDHQVNLADTETGRVSRVEINQMNLQQFLQRQPTAPDQTEPAPPPQTAPEDAPQDTTGATAPTGGEDNPDEY